MSVDLEAIAQRGRCDVSTLRLAIPLLEQGYSPPFLARYRRDELGGLDESSLWALWTAIQTEQQVQQRRSELVEAWQQTSLSDPAIGNAIKKSNSLRMLNRLGRRLKHETGDAADDATRLAVRVLNPQKEDEGDLSALAATVEGIRDTDAAIAGVDVALAKRLAGDPRMVAAAVRWLAKNAKIQISSIHDPHLNAEDGADDAEHAKADSKTAGSKAADAQLDKNSTPVAADTTPGDGAVGEPATVDTAPPEAATGEPTAAGEPTADLTQVTTSSVPAEIGESPVAPMENVAEPAAENVAEPSAENVAEPAAENVAEPAASTQTEPAADCARRPDRGGNSCQAIGTSER